MEHTTDANTMITPENKSYNKITGNIGGSISSIINNNKEIHK